MPSWMKIGSRIPLRQQNLNVTPSFVPLTSIKTQIKCLLAKIVTQNREHQTSSIMAALIIIFSACKMTCGSWDMNCHDNLSLYVTCL